MGRHGQAALRTGLACGLGLGCRPGSHLGLFPAQQVGQRAALLRGKALVQQLQRGHAVDPEAPEIATQFAPGRQGPHPAPVEAAQRPDPAHAGTALVVRVFDAHDAKNVMVRGAADSVVSAGGGGACGQGCHASQSVNLFAQRLPGAPWLRRFDKLRTGQAEPERASMSGLAGGGRPPARFRLRPLARLGRRRAQWPLWA